MAFAYNHVVGWPQDSIVLRGGKNRLTQILANLLLLVSILLLFIYADLIRRSDNTLSNTLLVRQLDEVSHYVAILSANLPFHTFPY